jgi:hypothetical protein
MYLFYTFFTTGWQANMWICKSTILQTLSCANFRT